MAITYERVIQEVLNRLGAVLGATASTAETNYDASPTTSTVIGPDFTPGMIEDALASTQSEIVECIAATPHHPERQRFADVTANLANLDAIPQVGASAARIIGIPGFVRDASDSKALLPTSLDRIRGFNEHSGSVYGGFEAYWYCINSGRIEHTRTNVVIQVCVYTRPTAFTGAIALDDHHEGGLVAGTVAKLALKESMFADLYAAASGQWIAHLEKIRNYGRPELFGKAQAAPASV